MNPKEAKKILPKDEYDAFEPILMNQISRTPEAKLKQRATLSRRLRDKYRDLAKRQGAAVRTRRTNETDTSLHERRARLFQEIIDRLESELERPNRPQRAPGPRSATAVRKEQASRRQETADKRQMTEARYQRTRRTPLPEN